MSEDKSGQTWEVGQLVILFQPYARGEGHAVRVLKIESVAPKTFVVNGDRFRKDRPQISRDGGFSSTVTKAVRMDDPRAEFLLAERFLTRQRGKVQNAELAWRKSETVATAADLQVELYAWAEAKQALDKAKAALREQRPSGGLLD